MQTQLNFYINFSHKFCSKDITLDKSTLFKTEVKKDELRFKVLVFARS